MDAVLVKTTLVGVLQQIQSTSGLACPVISGHTRPLDDLEQFDSKIWPVAIGMLAIKLGVAIPDDMNIFRRENSHTALTIDETVGMVVKLIETHEQAAPQTA